MFGYLDLEEHGGDCCGVRHLADIPENPETLWKQFIGDWEGEKRGRVKTSEDPSYLAKKIREVLREYHNPGWGNNKDCILVTISSEQIRSGIKQGHGFYAVKALKLAGFKLTHVSYNPNTSNDIFHFALYQKPKKRFGKKKGDDLHECFKEDWFDNL